ncbi:CLUMA_CG011395, isoform A [Clunio marinus]|uniref:CLUMA_CG011395, isoform A n=1 Tax=Clunio marinus TaxID=568069 RepID=A0A1J1IE29_9DIPT|nr:CLUMA_CG011395, isoform A [Clunio marinus]
MVEAFKQLTESKLHHLCLSKNTERMCLCGRFKYVRESQNGNTFQSRIYWGLFQRIKQNLRPD